MGPGRWGSRGDIKLGVSVTYSDINNTAVLIEIARKKGNYVPDLSFGTHFFQDLVEASIRYLPLYPDDPSVILKEDLLFNAPNKLAELAPDFSDLQDTIKVVEVASIYEGRVLRILMNADVEKAVAMFSTSGDSALEKFYNTSHSAMLDDDHAIWRKDMAQKMAHQIDPQRFGIKEMYLTGSAQKKNAQAASDIDLIINFKGTKTQKEQLLNWFEGWSLCLDEINYQRTGFKAGGLLDIKFLDEMPEVSIKENGDYLKLSLHDPI
jgi:hypothetical protein